MTAVPAAGAPVRPATAADAPRLAQTLAAAFADDPAVSWVLPPRVSRRHERLLGLFGLELPRSTRLGGTWSGGDGAAAAIWYPPGQWRLPPRELAAEVSPAAKVFGAGLPKALRVLAAMERGHPSEPHWYLYYLGVEPGRQGEGLGAALLRPVLDRCDDDGVGAYLEATTERNRALYQRHGFELMAEFHLPGGGPPMWRMWREPGAGPTRA